jgi:hypothetical protein
MSVKDDWGNIPMEFFAPAPISSSAVAPATKVFQPLIVGAAAAGGSVIHRGFALLPLLLQFLVAAIKSHPMQRSDVFYLLSVCYSYLMCQ